MDPAAAGRRGGAGRRKRDRCGRFEDRKTRGRARAGPDGLACKGRAGRDRDGAAMSATYTYDGSFEGFLSALALALEQNIYGSA